MKKNDDIQIRAVLNGFIVEPRIAPENSHINHGALVFDSYEDMVEFISGHFDRVKDADDCYEN